MLTPSLRKRKNFSFNSIHLNIIYMSVCPFIWSKQLERQHLISRACIYCDATKWISFKCYSVLYYSCWNSLQGSATHHFCDRLLGHAVACTIKHMAYEYFGRDLWIVLNETVMVVKQEWKGHGWGDVWICGMFAWQCCYSECARNFFSPPPPAVLNPLTTYNSVATSWNTWVCVLCPQVQLCTRLSRARINCCRNMWGAIFHSSRERHHVLWGFVVCRDCAG
jgi:hypothetical protein